MQYTPMFKVDFFSLYKELYHIRSFDTIHENILLKKIKQPIEHPDRIGYRLLRFLYCLFVEAHALFKGFSENAVGFGITDQYPDTRPVVVLVAQVICKCVRACVRIA